MRQSQTSAVIVDVSTYVSGPDAALAFVIEHRSRPTLPHMSYSTSTHVEAGLVIWVGVQAVGFSVAEAVSWGMSGGSGGGGGGGGAGPGFRGGGRRQWGQFWMGCTEETLEKVKHKELTVTDDRIALHH